MKIHELSFPLEKKIDHKINVVFGIIQLNSLDNNSRLIISHLKNCKKTELTLYFVSIRKSKSLVYNHL